MNDDDYSAHSTDAEADKTIQLCPTFYYKSYSPLQLIYSWRVVLVLCT